MSLSFVRRTRAKSVLEVLEEDCRFTFCRLSEGNDVDAILRLGVDNRNRYALEQAQRHKTPLVVTKTIILKRKGVALKYPFRVNEVEAVVFQVALALSLVPREPHRLVYRHSVYTSISKHAAV